MWQHVHLVATVALDLPALLEVNQGSVAANVRAFGGGLAGAATAPHLRAPPRLQKLHAEGQEKGGEGEKDGEAQTDIVLVGRERKQFSKEGRYKERINQSTKERLAMEQEDRLLLAKRQKVIGDW